MRGKRSTTKRPKRFIFVKVARNSRPTCFVDIKTKLFSKEIYERNTLCYIILTMVMYIKLDTLVIHEIKRMILGVTSQYGNIAM